MKKKKDKIDVGSAATGSILNTVTEMATFSSGGIHRNHHDNNEKLKPINTHRIRPNSCSICESDSKVGNRSKENSFKKCFQRTWYLHLQLLLDKIEKYTNFASILTGILWIF